MDVLSAVLHELRLESASYRWLELGDPFRIGFDQPPPDAGLPTLRGVHIIARGECELVISDGTVHRIGTGDLVVLPRGDPHVLRSVHADRGPLVSGFELSMRSDGNRLRAGGPGAETVVVCGAFVVHEPEHPALRGLPQYLHVPGDCGHAPPWLAPIVDALSAEAFEPGPGSDVVMSRLSDALVTRALRHHVESVEQPGWLHGLQDPFVAPALAAMHDNLERHWTVRTLARAAGLSRAAFAARFADRVGEPPMRYLLRLRMQRAKTLLRDQRATVAAVATRVGYSSEAAFAAAFRREVGAAPGAHRRGAAGLPPS